MLAARRAWVLSLPAERLPRGVVGGLVVDAQSVARSAVSPTGRIDSSARLRRSATLRAVVWMSMAMVSSAN